VKKSKLQSNPNAKYNYGDKIDRVRVGLILSSLVRSEKIIPTKLCYKLSL
jgi:hypothetical protein